MLVLFLILEEKLQPVTTDDAVNCGLVKYVVFVVLLCLFSVAFKS